MHKLKGVTSQKKFIYGGSDKPISTTHNLCRDVALQRLYYFGKYWGDCPTTVLNQSFTQYIP
ncbi:hypothetical protein [aff. Roholtiella sp. LEGE 12411]|uniref:hypothetical protein n=1 Tax=aff. Roholtiella sp. LEGE 12411 TaxID=1828822 RepID=UPI001882FA68|nr:hypothetical protein [aff. Roholtiella sp. LEGE 12411]MBE9035358.1 hypothetical protein [aff. Roholtiella sp. LEGE 12411]